MRTEPDTTYRRHERVMGTVASIRVHDDVALDVVGRHVDAALVELHRIERVFSTFLSYSEISRINRGELDVLDARREVLEVLDSCTWLEHASGGAFDAHRPDDPTQLDPAGFVKGWAAERAADRLRAGGLQHWWFGVGGDVIVHGHPSEHRMWQVAIADPLHPGEIIGVIDTTDGADCEPRAPPTAAPTCGTGAPGRRARRAPLVHGHRSLVDVGRHVRDDRARDGANGRRVGRCVSTATTPWP